MRLIKINTGYVNFLINNKILDYRINTHAHTQKDYSCKYNFINIQLYYLESNNATYQSNHNIIISSSMNNHLT